MSGEYNSSAQRTSPWVTAGRVIFTLALIGCIAFIFSNSMKIASVSTVSSSRVLTLLQAALRRLGHPALAQRLTDHIVRKLAHFCEYMLEGFLLMLYVCGCIPGSISGTSACQCWAACSLR